MAFGLKNFGFKGRAGAPENLSENVRQALESWRASPAPALDAPHFHTRYVVIDVATTGQRAEEDGLLGISAVGLQAGAVVAADAFALDLSSEESDEAAVDSQLMAFLAYAAKAPLVTYHAPFVNGFLQRVFRERLAVDFQPQWIDLAWLLPSLFKDKSPTPRPLDEWLELLAIDSGGRRDTMTNTLMLARLFQMLLVRANDQEILNAGKLIEESKSASFLRRTH
jgi:DNA polymerase-3 subunit epsilon